MKLYKDLTTHEGAKVLSIYNSSLGIIRIGNIINEIKISGKKIHFCGALGVGQRGLAELLLRDGFKVSGSDTGNVDAAELLELGLELHPSHSEENVKEAGLFVYTLAIADDNPEYLYAKKTGIPAISRAELAGYYSSLARKCITVAGSHGKSTVTGMLASILLPTGDATVLCGARLPCGTYSAGVGREYFIAEACEYKDSFLKFMPSVAIINNVELDHTDYFSSLDALSSSFVKYASRASDAVVINSDDKVAASLIPRIKNRTVTFGTTRDAEWRISNIAISGRSYLFSLTHFGKKIDEFSLSLPGIFNVHNAAAAIVASLECGVDIERIKGGVSSFFGVERRLQYLGEYKSRAVFYDYAHHPTEIYGGIAAIRAMGFDTVSVIFKSHTFSRTADLWDGFVRSLSFADYVIVGEIYGARERNEKGVSAEMLALKIGDRAFYSTDENMQKTVDNLTRGAIIVMGAADMRSVLRSIGLENKS